MKKKKYQEAEAKLRELLRQCMAELSDDAQQHVLHFLDVGELEMACESFTLSVHGEGIALLPASKKELIDLCQTLRLDEESVFRADFWEIARELLIDGNSEPSKG